MKKYDLMQGIILRGTFMTAKYCIPHLLKSPNPHILNIAAPPNHYPPHRMAQHLAYSLAKAGATMCVTGWA
jgi:citronellol/citronellal dehydrogenase